MPLDMNIEAHPDLVNATRTTRLVLGPCAICGKRLRASNHHGPWIPEKVHQKCWKAEAQIRGPVQIYAEGKPQFVLTSMKTTST